MCIQSQFQQGDNELSPAKKEQLDSIKQKLNHSVELLNSCANKLSISSQLLHKVSGLSFGKIFPK